MRNKKIYLQRLLVIYVAFFVVLLAGFAWDIVPNLTRGVEEGARMGYEIAAGYEQAQPQAQYMLWNIPIRNAEAVAIATDEEQRTVVGEISTLSLSVKEPADERSTMHMAFAAIGNSVLIYALMIGSALCFPIIIVLMYFIIRSVRRSIREELPLGRNNVWLLRTIALLTILTELMSQGGIWLMNNKAAEVLVGSGYEVNTTFQLNFGTLIMGLLLLFAAEVFDIGRELGEEQKLTI